MNPDISERSFEEAIECGLLDGGPDACQVGAAVREQPAAYRRVDGVPGGYHRRRPDEYDRALCLIPRDVLDFVYAAQPKKLYVFSRLLRRYLPIPREDLPREIQRNIDMESYRVQRTRNGTIPLERGPGEVAPIGAGGAYEPPEQEIEALSRIIRELNERFGTDLTEDRVFIRQLEAKLAGDEALAASVRANVPENARLTFDHIVTDRLQDMVDTNFKFYKRITHDPDFSRYFLDWLFDRFRTGVKPPSA